LREMKQDTIKLSRLYDRLLETSEEPGVYLMKNDSGKVLYVGKAGNLKKRLGAYFKNPDSINFLRHQDIKTEALVDKIFDFELFITDTEKEALILESSLIRKYKPKYNIVLKDDKRYLSLRINVKDKYPVLSMVRKVKKDGSLYFGPFTSAHAVRQTVKSIDKTFKLRKCKVKEFQNRSRPCLHYQMDRCLAPCCFDIEEKTYGDIVNEVVLFLKGKTPDLIRKIELDMYEASGNQDFERAASQRDRIIALKRTLEKQSVVADDFKDRDVIAVSVSSMFAMVTILVIRGGYLLGSRNFNFEDNILAKNKVTGEFIQQYYENNNFIPNEILVTDTPEDKTVLEDWLRSIRGGGVKILSPKRGRKSNLSKMAYNNADRELRDHINSRVNSREILKRLQKKMRLREVPEHIECFDNSNISGTEPVASMVVFKNGRHDKSSYRKYLIKTVSIQDDYAYMKEIMRRRYGKGEKSEPFPDLLLVDGGKGQLNVSISALKELGLEKRPDIAGIAKKDEKKGETDDKIFLEGRANPVNFGKDKDLLFFLQRIRDEAHRFALDFHRSRRAKASISSALDSVPGIGKKRKKLLLKEFGSVKKIRTATPEQISALPGISRETALMVKKAVSVS